MKLRSYPFLLPFVLPLSLFSQAQIPFHSDFECGETYIASQVKPGRKELRLIANHLLHEWPVDGGKGMIDVSAAGIPETFQYESRRGNVLKGVTGLRHRHKKWTDIRTGCLEGWDVASSGEKGSSGGVEIISPHSLFGSYSARFPLHGPGLTLFARFERTGPLFFRFYVRFSEDLLKVPEFTLRFFVLNVGESSLLRLQLRKTGQRKQPFLELAESSANRSVRLPSRSGFFRVEPETRYCIECRVQTSSRHHAQIELLVDDAILHKISRRSQALHMTRAKVLSLGKQFEGSLAGFFAVDEVKISDSRIGPIPPRPHLLFEDGVLRTVVDRHTQNAGTKRCANHWQMQASGVWVLPFFNSGRDTLHLSQFALFGRDSLMFGEELSLQGVQPAHPWFARVRCQNQYGNWSEWSKPSAVEPPPEFTAGFSKLSHAPVLRKAYFTKRNGQRIAERIQKGRWHDLRVEIDDAGGWQNLGHVDLYLNSYPGQNFSTYENRGGVFAAEGNYAVSLSIDPPPKLYAKEDGGSLSYTRIRPGNGLYVGHGSESFTVDPQRQQVSTAIRLLESARPGLWILKGYVMNKQSQRSRPFLRLFEVTEPETPHEEGSHWLWVIGLISAFVFGVGATLAVNAMRRGKDPAVVEQEKDDRFENQQELAIDPSGHRKVEMAIAYVKDNVSKPMSSKDVAQAVHLTPNWLGKAFHQRTGKPLRRYINEVKIVKAKELLRTTDHGIAEIGMAVGYNTLSHFLHTFRTIAGMSPSEYRKSTK